MHKKIDSFKFVDLPSRMIAKAWIGRDLAKSKVREIPWTGLAKKLSESTVALISSGAVALKQDKPFDLEGERQNPWWGDPTFRTVPRDSRTEDLAVYHLHVNMSYAEQDINCLFPLERLAELEREGRIGKSAPSHHSFMGYLLRPREMLNEHLPAVIEKLKDDQVDVVVLVPV